MHLFYLFIYLFIYYYYYYFSFSANPTGLVPAFKSVYLDWYFYPLEKKSYDLPINIKYSPVIKDDFFHSYSYDEIKRIEEEKLDYFADENESLEGKKKIIFLELLFFFSHCV